MNNPASYPPASPSEFDMQLRQISVVHALELAKHTPNVQNLKGAEGLIAVANEIFNYIKSGEAGSDAK